MIKIAVYNKKGGVGKTAIAANIGAMLVKEFKAKVLYVDCDSQGSLSDYLLAYTEKNDKTLYDGLYGGADIEEVIQEVSIPTMKGTIEPGLYAISYFDEVEDVNVKSLYDMKELLSKVEDDFDYCIMDLPPHLKEIALSSLIAADFVIVPARADTDSLKGFDKLMDIINDIRSKGLNVDLNILGVVLNDVNQQRTVQKNTINNLLKQDDDLIFKTCVKSASDIEKARHISIPVAYSWFSTSKNTYEMYKSLTQEIVDRIKERKSR